MGNNREDKFGWDDEDVVPLNDNELDKAKKIIEKEREESKKRIEKQNA